jgi:hypothetical protein
MRAWCICYNDGIFEVSVDSEKEAYRRMRVVAARFYLKVRGHYKSYAEFREAYFWHLHEVGVSPLALRNVVNCTLRTELRELIRG